MQNSPRVMTREEYFEEYGEWPYLDAVEAGPVNAGGLDLVAPLISLVLIIVIFEAIRRAYYYIVLGAVFPKK